MLSPTMNSPMFRMKYISQVKTQYKHLGHDSKFLEAPEHVLDKDLFIYQWNPFREIKPEDNEKAGSLVIIFSVWKTMIGTAVVSLPWAFQ